MYLVSLSMLRRTLIPECKLTHLFLENLSRSIASFAMGPSNPFRNFTRSSVPNFPSTRYHDDSSSGSSTPTDADFHIRSDDADDISFPQHTTQSRWADLFLRRVPYSVKRVGIAIVKWSKGPDPPRIWKITPILPKIQTAPIVILDRYLPKQKHRFWLLMACCFCWAVCFVAVLNKSAFTSEIAGYGPPASLSCTARFWYVTVARWTVASY